MHIIVYLMLCTGLVTHAEHVQRLVVDTLPDQRIVLGDAVTGEQQSLLKTALERAAIKRVHIVDASEARLFHEIKIAIGESFKVDHRDRVNVSPDHCYRKLILTVPASASVPELIAFFEVNLPPIPELRPVLKTNRFARACGSFLRKQR